MQKTIPDPPPRIVMYATPYCGDTRRARRVLDERGIAYEFVDFRYDTTAERLVVEINDGCRSSPTIIFPDGGILVEPSERELHAKLDALAAAGFVLETLAVES